MIDETDPSDGFTRGGSPLRGGLGGTLFLAYHSIGEDGPPFLSIPPAVFAEQLGWLAARGFVSGDPAGLARLAAGSDGGRRQVFFTFDDGFLDTATMAQPMMAEYGFTGIAFVLPPLADEGAALDWPEVAGERRRHPELMRAMDWRALERLVESGWTIGSHTMSHPHLPRLSDEALAQELEASRQQIASRLGECRLLAYPFGEWDGRVARAAAVAGYDFAFTLPYEYQRGAGNLSIPRITVDHRDQSLRFAIKVSRAGRTAYLSPLRTIARRAIGRRPFSHG